ncbi:MAG: hypothetical protein D6729_09740 [Deltaproteobacteria bacterium]|nr:MAG: hypothetical protein D6729_09740 [Deltaproteobacteria bacterium]
MPDVDRLRAGMRLELKPAKAVFLPEEHVPIRVVLVNGNREAVTVYELRKAFMHFSLTDTAGRTRRCPPQGRPGRLRPDRFYGLPVAGRLDKSVYLDGFCGRLEPGRYRVRLEYRIPYTHDGSAFGMYAITGTFVAETEIEVVSPRPDANLALHLARPKYTRADAPLPLDLTLTNYGPEPAYVLKLQAGAVHFEVRDARGRAVRCIEAARRGFGRADFVFLPAGQSRTESLDLARYCDIGAPGRYTVLARYEVPEVAVRTLRPVDRRRAFTGTVESNRLPFVREAPQARAEVRLEARPVRQPFTAGRPMVVTVTARNLGPDTVALAPPSIAWVDLEFLDESGRPLACRPGHFDRRLSPAAVAQVRRPGQGLTANIDLSLICPELSAGRWRVTFVYRLPRTSDRVPGPWGRDFPIWSGEARTTLPITVARGHAPPPLRRPPPPVALPAATLMHKGRFEVGGPIEVTLRVGVYGRTGRLQMPRPEPWMIRWTVTDRYGRRVPCRVRPAPRRLPSPADFVTLEGSQTITVSDDLGALCRLDRKGTYFVSAELRVPPTWNGRRYGLDAWTGAVATPPVRIKVKEAKHARGHRHWDDDGDSDG